MNDNLTTRLSERKARSLYRIRRTKETAEGAEIQIEGQRYINFSSNNYLGLANHPELKKAFQRGLDRYGVGSGASPLITGYGRPHRCLEEDLAAFTGRPRALVFSTGYMANVGAVGALARRGDTIIEDRLNHASLLDAAVLSRARLRRYPHTEVRTLERILSQSTRGAIYVVTDGVFSMEGDLAPLPALAEACKRHDAVLMVDDAHGFGVLGPEGRGTLGYFSMDVEQVPILVATFGKALGVFGAFVAGSEGLIETLIQEARSYLYTTALPPAVAVAVREALRLIRSESWRQERLFALIRYFKAGSKELGLPLRPSDTPIQPVVVGDPVKALWASERLQERGLYVVAIRPPTVPVGSARLRITITAAHTYEHLDRLLDALDDLLGCSHPESVDEYRSA